MDQSNFARMIALAEEFFQTKNDPSQLAVSEEVIERLRKIHPATLGELTDDDGPIAWILIIPTTRHVMERFLACQISERDLLEMSERDSRFDAAYLCSALVLPEYRRRGLARRLAIQALRQLQQDHPIAALYFWAFSEGGAALAASIAAELQLPLFRRNE